MSRAFQRLVVFLWCSALLWHTGTQASKAVARIPEDWKRWGKQPPSGVYRRAPEMTSIEGAAKWFLPGDRIAVWKGKPGTSVQDWHILGATAGWVLPMTARTIFTEDLEKSSANVLLTTSAMDAPPLPANWSAVYGDQLAIVYRNGGRAGVPGWEKLPRFPQEQKWDRRQSWPSKQTLVLRLILTFAAFIVCGLAGWPLLGRQRDRDWVERVALSVIIGALPASIVAGAWLYLGAPPEWQGLGVSAIMLILAGGLQWSQMGHFRQTLRALPSSESSNDSLGKAAFAFSVGLYLIFAISVTLGSDAGCAPGLGHYGYKAKVFWQEGWPADFPGGEGWRLHVPEYPLGGTLLCEWLFSLYGDADLHIARITQGIWLALIAVLSASWLKRKFTPPAAPPTALFLSSIVALGGAMWIFYLREFYQETWLLALLLGGLLSTIDGLEANDQRAVFTGIFLVSATAWIKSEGMFLWVALAASLGLLGLLKTTWKSLLGGFLVWVVPWRIYLLCHGVKLLDFQLNKPFLNNWISVKNDAGEILQEVWRVFSARDEIPFGCCLAGAALILAFSRKNGDGRITRIRWLPLFVALLYAAIFCSAYLASILPLNWHLNGVARMVSTIDWVLMIWGLWMFATDPVSPNGSERDELAR